MNIVLKCRVLTHLLFVYGLFLLKINFRVIKILLGRRFDYVTTISLVQFQCLRFICTQWVRIYEPPPPPKNKICD